MHKAFHLVVQRGERLLPLVADLVRVGPVRRSKAASASFACCLLARQTLTFFSALLPLLFVELALVPLDFRSRQGLGLLAVRSGRALRAVGSMTRPSSAIASLMPLQFRVKTGLMSRLFRLLSASVSSSRSISAIVPRKRRNSFVSNCTSSARASC